MANTTHRREHTIERPFRHPKVSEPMVSPQVCAPCFSSHVWCTGFLQSWHRRWWARSGTGYCFMFWERYTDSLVVRHRKTNRSPKIKQMIFLPSRLSDPNRKYIFWNFGRHDFRESILVLGQKAKYISLFYYVFGVFGGKPGILVGDSNHLLTIAVVWSEPANALPSTLSSPSTPKVSSLSSNLHIINLVIVSQSTLRGHPGFRCYPLLFRASCLHLLLFFFVPHNRWFYF